MIGQRQHINTALYGAFNQFCRREQAVGTSRMAMQVYYQKCLSNQPLAAHGRRHHNKTWYPSCDIAHDSITKPHENGQ